MANIQHINKAQSADSVINLNHETTTATSKYFEVF